MTRKTTLIGNIVAASIRFPLLVLVLALGLTAASLAYTARHFAMTADTAQLISAKLPWRQNELAFEAAFPQLNNLTMIVVDGATPELADSAASRLAAMLRAKPTLFRTVQRPDGGPFFERDGVLLLALPDVEATTKALVQATPLLGMVARDPSLRGILSALTNMLAGVRHGQGTLRDIEPMASALADTFEKAQGGRPVFFSWRSLLLPAPAVPQAARHIVLVQPVLDYAALEPGQAASGAIRETARSLGLDAAHGVTVRLTGPVPLADEEFSTLAQDTDLIVGAMAVALLGILWLAVRSVRIVVAILATTLIGLVVTAALGLVVVGRFNLISVAFIPLFVGLGVDFSIQFSVRALAERRTQPTVGAALISAGAGIGGALGLSAAAIGAGFFAFLPTTYIGVAELGTIAGLGMAVAFALSIVLLPALLVLVRPRVDKHVEAGFPLLAPVDAFLRRRRRAVLAVALVAAVGSASLLPRLRFDFNPLNLKSATVESMATLQALDADPDWTPNAINVLAPSLDKSAALSRALEALPDVSRTITLQSFVPTQQTEKLELIGEAAKRVGPALDRGAPPPPASDAELLRVLSATATALRETAADAKGDPGADAARRLASALDGLGQSPPAVRSAVGEALSWPLGRLLDQIGNLLQARPVTSATLPADLVADWITADGRARVQVLPRADRSGNAFLRRFSAEVQGVAPDASGQPISISASGDSIVEAFLQAGAYSIVTIIVLLAIVLRRARDVALTIVPVLLSGLLTFATCAALDLPLNFTNIIALPLLFGVGVAFNIYFVMAWRAGDTAGLKSSLMRGVVFSAMTTACAFGALWLSSHPGTASMGRLLMISLGWELLVTLLFRPALLARPPA